MREKPKYTVEDTPTSVAKLATKSQAGGCQNIALNFALRTAHLSASKLGLPYPEALTLTLEWVSRLPSAKAWP